MKKLLVLNGSHSDVPLIEAAKRLGFHVTTTGNDPGLVGHRYADAYRREDFSDRDAVLKVAQELGIDAVCSCANDFGAITAAYVAEKLELPGHDSFETALTLHHKHRFKDFALAHGISTPRAVQYSSVETALAEAHTLAYPVIVKPVDMTGGKGVSKVASRDGFPAAVQIAFARSRMGRFLVEEWVEGTYHSFSAFVVDRKIAFGFSDNEYSLNGTFHVSTSGGPATGIGEVRDQLVAESERIIKLLDLKDGVFHIQYIHAGSKAWIIEITRRCSGDFYPYPVRYASGLEWAEWIVKAESGLPCGPFPKAQQRGFFGRHCVFATRNGIVGDLAIAKELQDNVIDRFTILPPGEVVDERRANRTAAILFLQYGSRDEMVDKSTRMNAFVSVDMG